MLKSWIIKRIKNGNEPEIVLQLNNIIIESTTWARSNKNKIDNFIFYCYGPWISGREKKLILGNPKHSPQTIRCFAAKINFLSSDVSAKIRCVFSCFLGGRVVFKSPLC
jgi:hypothetical protein